MGKSSRFRNQNVKIENIAAFQKLHNLTEILSVSKLQKPNLANNKKVSDPQQLRSFKTYKVFVLGSIVFF